MTSAERMQRMRARRRGETIPLGKPGRPRINRPPKPPRVKAADRNIVWQSGDWRIQRVDEYFDRREGFPRHLILQVRENDRWLITRRLSTREELYLLLEAIEEKAGGGANGSSN